MVRTIRLAVLAAAVMLAPAWAQDAKGQLDRVLTQMDETASKFKTTQANFVWDQFQKVVNETDTQKGKVYFRKLDKQTQMVADIAEPDSKYVLFADGKVQVYQPKIEQVAVYDASKNRADFETFLVLGFGGGGHDMLKSFDVKYLGNEKANGVDAAKLELTPKSAKLRNNFQSIFLWIDPARGISVQQQFIEPSGDYRLAKYSDIEMNQRIPDTVFKLKTTGKTKIISPQG